MNASIPETYIKPVGIKTLDGHILQRIVANLPKRHHLDGVWAEWQLPILGFRLPPAVADLPRYGADTDISVQPFIHQSVFGVQFTVQAEFPTTGDVTHIAIPRSTPIFEPIRVGRFIAAFISRHQPAFAFEVSVQHEELSIGNWDSLLRFAPIVADDCATYFTAIDKLPSYRPYLMKEDRLSIGWADSYGQRVIDLQRSLSSTPPAIFIAIANENAIEPDVRLFFRSLVENGRRLDWAITWIKHTAANDKTRLIQLLKHASALQSAGIEKPGAILKEICEVYCWSSGFTDCGQHIAWLDSLNQCVATMEIDPKSFPVGFCAEEYWKRQLWDLPYELGRILTDHDVPVKPSSLIDNINRFPIVEDIGSVNQLADDFFADAIANKTWTIPPGAIIEQGVGPFEFLEMHEFGQSVFCVFRTKEGETYTAAVNPEKGLCTFNIGVIAIACAVGIHTEGPMELHHNTLIALSVSKSSAVVQCAGIADYSQRRLAVHIAIGAFLTRIHPTPVCRRLLRKNARNSTYVAACVVALAVF